MSGDERNRITVESLRQLRDLLDDAEAVTTNPAASERWRQPAMSPISCSAASGVCLGGCQEPTRPTARAGDRATPTVSAGGQTVLRQYRRQRRRALTERLLPHQPLACRASRLLVGAPGTPLRRDRPHGLFKVGGAGL